ncbi:hypothetical protein C8R41DRAFT_902323 [Lentinula lateritia]|uniref:Uncharacterized protein n=1 Tax=Lentinula lateritia TaxID=40482 RepID=A0ABQ8VL87_9AGAR|nr:hypothetical protein C8R41DRAFT_902323 [Lentinula lateritia]
MFSEYLLQPVTPYAKNPRPSMEADSPKTAFKFLDSSGCWVSKIRMSLSTPSDFKLQSYILHAVNPITMGIALSSRAQFIRVSPCLQSFVAPSSLFRRPQFLTCYELAVQPETPTSLGADTDGDARRTCNLNEVCPLSAVGPEPAQAGAVPSVQHVDSYPVTQPGSEGVGKGSKPMPVATPAVGKVTSFTFEEEGQPLKEPVNTNGKRRSSTQNAKAGPSKVARTAGQVKD